MRVALIGSRWLASATLAMLIERGDRVSAIALRRGDSFARAADAAGIERVTLDGAVTISPRHVPAGTDVIVAAHCHAFIPAETRAAARLAAIGYHPSLLPRHRGIAAVEWTIRSGDAVAGGSVYHLTDEMDAGPIAAAEWCFVYPGEDAAALWKRALGPMGVRLLGRVLGEIEATGGTARAPQDEAAISFAP